MDKLAYGKRPIKNLWKLDTWQLLLCPVQLIVETRLVTAGYFNRWFRLGHGGPGLAGDHFFQPRLTYEQKTPFPTVCSRAEVLDFFVFVLWAETWKPVRVLVSQLCGVATMMMSIQKRN